MSGGRNAGRRLGVWIIVLLVALPGAGDAAISTPQPGATVRGDVSIHEDTGGTRPGFWCSNDGLDSTITVTRLSDGAAVHQQSKGGPGAWTSVWETHGLAIGQYRLRSDAQSKNAICQISTVTLSEFDVTLENLSTVQYTGETATSTGSTFTASARLADSVTGRPIATRRVEFTLNNQPAGACVTAADGTCSTAAVALAEPGTHEVEVRFAGDCCWRSSSDRVEVEITLLPACIVNPLSCLPDLPEPPEPPGGSGLTGGIAPQDLISHAGSG